jgi:hypothetical protein
VGALEGVEEAEQNLLEITPEGAEAEISGVAGIFPVAGAIMHYPMWTIVSSRRIR